MTPEEIYNAALIVERDGGAKPEGGFHKIRYRIFNGTAYHAQTPLGAIMALEYARQSGKKTRIWLGQTRHENASAVDAGKVWLEESDVLGRIGRSIGPKLRVPIMLSEDDSGGPSLLDHCVLRVNTKTEVIYQDPDLKFPKLELVEETLECPQKHYTVVYRYGVKLHGEIQARFRTREGAEAYVKFFSPECGINPSTIDEPACALELVDYLLEEFADQDHERYSPSLASRLVKHPDDAKRLQKYLEKLGHAVRKSCIFKT